MHNAPENPEKITPSFMHPVALNPDHELDPNRKINVYVGGQYITYDAQRIGEDTYKQSRERGWLKALSRALIGRSILSDSDFESSPEEKLKNAYTIAKEAIRRGVLTQEQVVSCLDELEIGKEEIEHFIKSITNAPLPAEASTAESFGKKLRRLNLNDRTLTWTNAIGDIVAIKPSDQEVCDAVSAQLSDKNVVFRMMNKEELQAALDAGVVGGVANDRQIKAGQTWWGGRIEDSLSVIGGATHVNQKGATWGGLSTGYLVAVRTDVINKAAVKKTLVNDTKLELGYMAYLTTAAIPVEVITDIFRVSLKHEDIVRVEQLKL